MKTDRLREIVSKQDRLTAENKAFIEDLCKELGVAFYPKSTRCKSCYQDAAVKCYNIIAKAEKEAAQNESAYVLKPNVDVIYKGVRLNAATLTDELAERMIAQGFSTEFFEKWK